MAVGIMVLPPYNKQSTPLIKKSIGTQAIVSNVSSSVYGARSNRHTRLSIDEYSSVTDTSIIIAKDELDHPMHNEYANAIAHMIEIAKRSEKLLIVAPGPKIPLLPILIASKIRPLTDIRAIVGGRLLTSAEVIAELANADKRLLGTQWDELRKQPAKIRPEDCFKTPNGATLRPYQQQMVNFAVEKKRAGLFVDMGLGKAVDDQTVIPTPDGPRKVKDIRVGDQLYDRKGQPTNVLATYKHKNKKAYQVTLKDGRSFICCDEHLVPYYSHSNAKKIMNKPLKDMLSDYKQTRHIENGQPQTKYKYRIPQNEAIEMPQKTHVIPPYAMGALIGDGLFKETSLAMSSNEQDVVHNVARLLGIPTEQVTKNSYNYTWRLANHDGADIAREELRRLGLKGKGTREKFIPDEYLTDSIQNRMELLKGLMDTDGSTNISHKGARHYSYSTINNVLAEQIRQLCLSLGFGVNVNKYAYDGKLNDISIRIFTPEIIVSSKKHLDIVNTGTHKSIHDKMTPIVDITEVPSRDMTCFTVDNDERLFLINDYIVTHNTLATLATLDHLVKEDKIDPKRPVLIVAPIMVALDTWSREAEKWGYDMDVKINIQLSVEKREALLETLLVPQEKLTLFTTNPAQLKPILQFFARKGVSSPFDVVIVDELSQFKSPDAQRFEHLTQISELSEYFFGLTGTPSPNNLIDIWSQMIAIDSKNRRLLGDNFYVYRGNFFEPTQTGMRGGREVVFDWGLKRGADQAIYDRMKESAISMRSEGLIDLPKIVFDNKYVKLPKKAMQTYQKMDKVLRQQLREQEADGEEQGAVLSVDGRNIEIANSAVLTSKLLQLSGGALYDNVADASANETNYTVFHNEKMKAVKELVENSTSPILIFYFFKSELERLREFIEFEHLSSKMKQDDIRDTIKRWNDGKIPVIVAHPGSVGHGLNLQDGGHTMVWLTTTWSNEQYRQAVKRLYRSGQKETVTVIHLLAEGTEDENVIKRIDLKETGQDELMRALDIAQRE